MYRITGVEFKEGDYQGRHYEYYNIHTLSDEKILVGNKAEVYKIKPQFLSSIINLADLGKLIDKKFETAFYDKYGNCTNFKFVN